LAPMLSRRLILAGALLLFLVIVDSGSKRLP
jgi:hypothetical protein